MDKQYDDEVEIDLMELLFAIKAKAVLILAVGILGGLISFAYAFFLTTPMYKSTASMLVISKDTTVSSLSDLQLATNLTNDYMILAVSQPVLEQVIEDLNLSVTYQELGKLITVNNPTSSRILEFTVEYSDPAMAAEIVNDLTTVATNYIAKHMDVLPPTVFETGIPAEYPSSLSLKKYVAIGVLLGLIISAGIVVLREILDDTVKDEEDVEKYLDLPVLAAVPDRKDYINMKDRRKGGSRSHLKNEKKQVSSQNSHAADRTTKSKTRTVAGEKRTASVRPETGKEKSEKQRHSQKTMTDEENGVKKEKTSNGTED